MRKSKSRPLPLGTAAASSIGVALGMALVIVCIMWCFPSNPARQWVEYVSAFPTAGIEATPLYQSLLDQIDNLQMFVVSPLAMLAGGVMLGIIMGEEYGVALLYRWAAGCGAFLNIVSLAFLWGNKLVHQGMRLNYWDLPPRLIVAQLLALVFWIGMYVVGAEIGRRVHNLRAKPAPAR